jgi:hypothetical protein
MAINRRYLLRAGIGLVALSAFAAVVVPKSAWEMFMMEVSSDHNVNWGRDANGQLVATSNQSPDQSYKPILGNPPPPQDATSEATVLPCALSTVAGAANAISISSKATDSNELAGLLKFENGKNGNHECQHGPDGAPLTECIGYYYFAFEAVSDGQYKVTQFYDNNNVSRYWSPVRRIAPHVYEAEFRGPFDLAGRGDDGITSCVSREKYRWEVVCGHIRETTTVLELFTSAPRNKWGEDVFSQTCGLPGPPAPDETIGHTDSSDYPLPSH